MNHDFLFVDFVYYVWVILTAEISCVTFPSLTSWSNSWSELGITWPTGGGVQRHGPINGDGLSKVVPTKYPSS